MLKLLATILILGFCQSGLGQLSARFSADKTGGCGPLVVHFSNSTAGASASAAYHWDLGNGNLAVVADPTATYTQPGAYTIVLTVQDGPQTSTYSQAIDVYQPPAATFAISNPKVCSPGPVNFLASVTPGSGAIANYLWDFGDGSTQTVQSVATSHGYLPAGVYGVNLTVTDTYGCAATASQAGAVTVLPALLPSFAINPQVLCTVSSPVTFTNNTTGPGALTYQWNFGDGGSGSTAGSPTYTYGAKGTYTVILTATSSVGCVAADTQTNVLNVANFQTDFTVPASVCQGMAATFTDSSSPAPSAETWTVDGAAAGAGVSLSSSLAAAGTHTITLTNSYAGCTQSVTHSFNVNAAPVMPPFDAVQQSGCGAPVTVNFLDHTPGAVSWLWAFDYNPFVSIQNYTSGGPAISMTYGEDMNWPVQLTVRNAQGCQASEVQTVVVTSPYATIIVVAGTPLVCGQPMTETFGSAQIGNLSSWEWVFGDGDSTNAQSPTHTFTNPGDYQTFLRWTDKNGCSGISNILYTPITAPFENIDFTADQTTVCVGQGVSFTGSPNMATDNAFQTSWGFGDGSALQYGPTSAFHAYTTPGVYTVSVSLVSAGECYDQVVKTNYITVLPAPTISFTAANTCDSPRAAVTFTPTVGNGATSIQWDFGDNSSQTTAPNGGPLTHTYGANGFYSVVATATNGGCSSWSTGDVTVELKPLALNLGISATTLCPAVYLTDTLQETLPPGSSTDIGAFQNLQWYYGDGTPFAGTQNYVVNTYDFGYYSSVLSGFQPGETGLYVISTNETGCKDTSNIAKLIVGGVTATFQIVQNNICYQQPVTLEDMTKTAPGDPIVSWQWDFGDGTNSTSTTSGTVQHLFAHPGTYMVTLTVTDQSGCSSSSQAAGQITVDGPQASFGTASGATTFPQGAAIQFANTSNTANTAGPTYTWTFGDGNGSSQADPTYTYPQAGTYTVTLRAQDGAGGCVSVATMTLTIQPVNNAFSKSAAYVASGSCPPVLVQFTNLSVNYSSYTWDFGDGETVSNVADPSHVYQHPGIYIVSLTVVGDNGQATTTVDSVIVAQPSAALSAVEPAICEGQSVTLQSTGNVRVKTYDWDFGDGTVISSADSTVSHAYATPGVYEAKLVVADSLGCSAAAAASDLVDVHSPPGVSVAPAVAMVCLGKTVVLKATGGLTFSWSPGSSLDDSTVAAPVAKPLANTEYIVTIGDNIGCTNSDSIAVRVVRPDTVLVSPDSAAICPGKDIQLTASGAYTYRWIGDGLSAADIANPVATPAATTVYSVAGGDSAGCFEDTVSVIVTLLVQPTVNAGPDIQVLAETPVTIPAVGSADVVSWLWTPATDLSCTDCAQPVCSPKQSQEYIVTVTAGDGCTARDTVVVELVCDEAKVRIPDAFTPNGDGHNDRFTILGAISMVNHLVIFDRWGVKVFEADHFYPADPHSGWDGTVNGQPSPPGVYVYYAEMQCPGGGVFGRRGTVVLIR